MAHWSKRGQNDSYSSSRTVEIADIPLRPEPPTRVRAGVPVRAGANTRPTVREHVAKHFAEAHIAVLRRIEGVGPAGAAMERPGSRLTSSSGAARRRRGSAHSVSAAALAVGAIPFS
jgi:hypothetical protein